MGRFAWGQDFWKKIKDELQVDMVAAYQAEKTNVYALPAEVETFGNLSPDDFAMELARSRLLIGLGDPKLSPSPYHGLCQVSGSSDNQPP